jgi:hypothetical protein
MKPTQDVIIVTRHKHDAMSVALQLYGREWRAWEARNDGSPPPPPPPASLADNKTIRVDEIRIYLKAP